ncbi:SDR family NAD(P)-dependent oxidoreductase [Craterilacuibacter sinensis]|uniref:SDR family NAD(P)-dependent oxidoreductase n=1 Tax=Craterilacuibacter sinensis TaxID=2686017 RepID=A0A845BUT4_9NEIS|nr:SDR family NAD(P)-dependent oxidoreductase [Craterilacuibacter sinensis]MXR36283.1 SDR family NAD(P)-dependent oxidoreductase [Craterilacuibacter sinensis]
MSLNPRISNWHGKRVWLIGAGHGIGAALASRLQGAGATLALSGRNRQALEEVARQSAIVLPFDATDAAAWQHACDTLSAQWGRIDLIILLAGDYQALRAWELTPDSARRLTDINLMAPFYAVAACVPQLLRQQNGGLALVASVAGAGGMPNALVYGATKAAVNHLAQTLYLDLAPRGIGVWVINPGFVKTRLTAGNAFTMPALISPEQAADEILAGFAAGNFDIHFPKRFTRWVKLAAHLPYRAWFYLMHKVTGL